MKYGKLYGAVTLVCLAMVLSIGLIWAEEYDPDDISTWPHDGYHNAFEATGTEFVISGNPYFPDLKITSKEEVHIVLEAFQDMVSYHIEAVDTNKHQTKITIEGLDGFFTGEESGKLYRHEDGAFEDSFKLKKHNATYTYHQDIRKAHHVYIMPEHGTVYIGIEANGGTPPPTPPYNYDSGSRTYTLTQNILDYVVITANNITLDGGGYYISGTNTGYGIYLNSNTNVTLTDCTVQYFYVGIYVSGGSTNTIASSTSITNQNSCICLYNTDYNTVSGCAASKSVASNGIVLTGGADYNTISDSSSSGNAYNGIAISNNALNNTVTGCVVNGNSSNGMYINCNYSTLTDNTCSSNTNLGIAVYGARYNSVTYNTCYGNGTSGIGLPSGTSNTVVANNTCTGNSWDGIRLWNANYNTVTTNTCQSNTVGGIGILSCSGKSLTITGNSLISNAYGVTMSNNATTTSILVYQNNIFNNTTWNAYSTDAINLYWYNSATQQNEGNFWGHVIEPAFTAGPGAGADTNAANVTNDYAYLVKNGWLLGYAPHEEINLPSARGAGSDGLSPRISDANATVDLASGNVNLAVPLTYIVPVDGLPTNVVIYGNSIPATDNPSSPLGYNWTHTFNMRLIIQTDGSIIQVTESGREILFWKDGESPAHWVSYPHYGLYRTITIDSSTGNYVLTNKDRTTLTFYPNGKFYKAQDLNNHTVTATYDPNGDLNYVTLANGMVIYFDVDSGTHCINELYIKNQSGSPISSSVTDFDYTSGLLTGATKNGGAWAWGWSYNYNQVTQTSPESYNNRVFNMTGNKCTSITGPLNEDITIVYHANPDHTVVTGRTGKVDDVYTNAQLGVWTRWIDEETSRGFDSSRNVITETKPSGATTYWAYDSRGNVLSTTNAAGANTQYLYGDSTNPDLPTEIGNALGITTTRTYSTAGQLTQEIEDYGTGKLNRKTTWEYYTSNETSDAAVIGQLYKHHRDPDTLNLTTTYNYDSNGYGIKETVTDGGTFSLVTGERVTNDIGWITTSYNVDYPSYIANNVATVYEYDERGNRILETDPNGIETASEYDLLDRCTSRTVDSTGLNLVTTWAYNWGGVTEQHIDPSGLNISSYTEYDAAGKVISRTDAAGALTEYYYYPNARLWKTKRQLTAAPDYAWTEYFYDVNGNQTGILDAGNHAISMTYDSVDRLVTTTDVASSTTVQYGFDLLGRQTYTIDARGNQSWTFYNNVNEVTHMRSAESTMGVYITTAYAYDAVGRRTQVIGPWYDTDGDGIADAGEYVNPTIGTINAPVAYTEYDPADRVTRTYINNTSTTDAKYYYDAMGDRSIHYVETLVDSATSSYQMVSSQYNKNKQVYLTALDPMGTLNEQTYHYFDNAGRQTAATAAYGSAVSTTSYSILDKASRVITSYVSSTLYATGFSYNARGQVLTTTDAEGRVTTNAYDISGRLTSTTDALGNVVSYGYNVEDLMTSLTYTKGGSSVPTIYTYNDQHRLIRTDQPGYDITNPTGVITNSTYTGYDANGNVTSRTDGAGVNIQYTFDNINRMYRKTYPDATTADFGFDAASNTLTISDTNTSTANEFDALNRLTKTTDYMYNPAKVIDYTYYNDGTRKTVSALGSTETYTYDKAVRLKTISFTGFPSAVASYDYNALGLRTKETLVNGATVTYTYNSTTRWLTGVYNQTSAPTSTSISTFTYTHDLVGNRVTENKYLNGNNETITYTYGTIYRLLKEEHTGPVSTTISFNYDGPGNRTQMTKDYSQITLYSYNNANQCISWTDTSGVCFIDNYNGNGCLITETNQSTGQMYAYNYDYENHQTVYSTTGTSASYTTDAMGRRIAKTVNGTTERYTYDGANVMLDWDNAGNFQKGYIMAGLDEPVCLLDNQMNSYYYMQDGLGSVRNLIDNNQAVKNTYDYWAFGGLRLDSELVPQRYKFTGREWDSESGTQHSRERQYRPTWGRFLRRDPIGYGAGINLYSYCGNNPVNRIDPWGLMADNTILSTLGEEWAVQALEGAGRIILWGIGHGKTSVAQAGADIIAYNTIDGVVEFIDNKAFNWTNNVSPSKLTSLTKNFAPNLIKAKELIQNSTVLSNELKIKALSSLEGTSSTFTKVITNYGGRVTQISKQLVAKGIQFLSREKVAEQAAKLAASRAAAVAAEECIASKVLKGSGKLVGVLGFIFFCDLDANIGADMPSPTPEDIVRDFMIALTKEGLADQMFTGDATAGPAVIYNIPNTLSAEKRTKVIDKIRGNSYFSGDVQNALIEQLQSEWGGKK